AHASGYHFRLWVIKSTRPGVASQKMGKSKDGLVAKTNRS
ncbi:MAG: hypothetical protein ACI87E_001470, partial [Mariniblastus sp.]